MIVRIFVPALILAFGVDRILGPLVRNRSGEGSAGTETRDQDARGGI